MGASADDTQWEEREVSVYSSSVHSLPHSYVKCKYPIISILDLPDLLKDLILKQS